MDLYRLPLCVAETEFKEKKSRFISNIAPVSSEYEALAFLRSIREKHREASHNVYAYRISGRADGQYEPGLRNRSTPGYSASANNGDYNSGACRHSDDGEPSGTAGMPLLDVFLKRDIYDFCCVATRYFGGILLGAGGLVRAYTRCGADALAASGVGVMREMTLCASSIPYSLYEPIKRLLSMSGAEITSENFGAEVELGFLLTADRLSALRDKFTELSSGAISISVKGTQMSVSDAVAVP